MGYSLITKDYIRLERADGTLLSKHMQEREALAILSRQENGSYVIRYPETFCTVFGGIAPTPVPTPQIGQLEADVKLVSYGGGVPGHVATPPTLSPMHGSTALFVGASADSFSVSAVIPFYDENLVFMGYGPSYVPPPRGVFFGRTDLVNGDKWKFDPYPGLAFTEHPGGWADIVGPAGTYTLGWKLWHSLTGSVENGIATGIVLS